MVSKLCPGYENIEDCSRLPTELYSWYYHLVKIKNKKDNALPYNLQSYADLFKHCNIYCDGVFPTILGSLGLNPQLIYTLFWI